MGSAYSIAAKVRGAFVEAIARMEAADVPSARLAAELLLLHVVSKDRAWLYANLDTPLDAGVRERYLDLVTQRAAGTPTQYLVGWQEFWGLEFEVEPGVLIPRPETEHVVEVALERLGVRRAGPVRIADVGTGSGCIAIALACELPESRIVATDISPAALALAARNAARLSVIQRIQFLNCNLLDSCLRGEYSGGPDPLFFDVIVSNPPYVAGRDAAKLPREVSEHEPAGALIGGEFGADLYPPLVAQAVQLVVPGGVLVIELGYNSLPRVQPLFDAEEWSDARVTRDLAGIPRVLSALRTIRPH